MSSPTPSPELARRADGRLVLRRPGQDPAEIAIQVAVAFPWSCPRQWISLRDDKGAEQVLVEDLDHLPPATLALIEEELRRESFVPRITAIRSIEPNVELVHWQVETDAGPRQLIASGQDALRNMPGGQLLLRDVCGDLYLVVPIEQLDARSRKLIWPYVD